MQFASIDDCLNICGSLERRARQARLECQRREASIDHLRQEVGRRQRGERIADLPHSHAVIRASIWRLSEAIQWAQTTRRAIVSFGAISGDPKRGGRPCTYGHLLSQIDADLISLHTLRETIHGVFDPKRKLPDIARRLAARLQNEATIQSFKKRNPNKVRWAFEHFRKSGITEEFAMKLLVRERRRCALEWEPWDELTSRTMALDLIEAAVLFTDAFDRVPIHGYKGNRPDLGVVLQFSESGLQWWKDAGSRLEDHISDSLPMICVPIPWQSGWGGGYVSSDAPPLALIKRQSRAYLASLKDHDLSRVYRAVNAIQSTPWRINDRVYEVALALWGRGGAAAGLPPVSHRAIVPQEPPYSELGDGKREWIRWARHRDRIRAEDRQIRGRIRRTRRILDLAGQFLEEDAIFFPHHLDFRGRIYSCCPILQPQGADLERGLLRFAVGKALRDEQDAGWLAIHGANRFGCDDTTFEKRVQWVWDNESRILDSATDPQSERNVAFWGKAKHPFQFLAFCFEWGRYRNSGDGAFISTLPIALDGSCNGLQHLYALTRDLEGGRLVNLVASALPADIYATVAEDVRHQLERIEHDGADETKRQYAKKWLAFKVDRDLVKPSVMIRPYGGTLGGVRRAIAAEVDDAISKGDRQDPFMDEDERLKAERMLAQILWRVVNLRLGSARSTMMWLQRNARALAKEGSPIRWTTPVGFPVLQERWEMQPVRVTYGPMGHRLESILLKRTGAYSASEQANGISPNYTHSLDAAHLMLTVCKALEHGVLHFAMIHDSYATTAADTSVLSACLREAFAEIYGADPLARMACELQSQYSDATRLRHVGPPPPLRDWSPDDVCKATYFFH